jgi:NAD(P)H-flavin reductase
MLSPPRRRLVLRLYPTKKVLNRALSKKDDKTMFKLIFANVSPADILLREEFDKLQKAHPDRFSAVFVVDKPSDGWTGMALVFHATVGVTFVAMQATQAIFRAK